MSDTTLNPEDVYIKNVHIFRHMVVIVTRFFAEGVWYVRLLKISTRGERKTLVNNLATHLTEDDAIKDFTTCDQTYKEAHARHWAKSK